MSAMPFTAKRHGGQGITYILTGHTDRDQWSIFGFKPRKSLVLGTGHSYCIFDLVYQINADFLSV